MNVWLLLGTLIGSLAYVLSRKQIVQTIGLVRIPAVNAKRHYLLDDKPDPVRHVESTVRGTSNVDTYTLNLYVKSGTTIEDVEILFALQDYANAAAIASSMQAAIQAWPYNATTFPNWSSITVTQTDGILSVSGGSYSIAFGYSTEAEELLDKLGFEDIPVTNTASLVTQSTLTAVRQTKLALFKWEPTFDVAFGDRIRVHATSSVTIKVSGTGIFLAYVDGIGKYCRRVAYLTGQNFVLHSLSPFRITLSVVYPRDIPTSSTSLITDEYEYASPGILYLPTDTKSVFIEAIGAGGSSSSGSFGGAGASVSGFLQTIPDSLTITIGSGPGDLTRITGTNIDIIAGGGGAGGTFANGGSSRHHGLHGYATQISGTRIGKYAVLQNGGRGATNSAGGLSPKGSAGFFLTGGSLTGHPRGGHGHYGGGSGGKETYLGTTYYGGAGGGSSFAKGLTHVYISEPRDLKTAPKTTKKTIAGSYGNGGNVSTPYGPGYVKISVTHD